MSECDLASVTMQPVLCCIWLSLARTKGTAVVCAVLQLTRLLHEIDTKATEIVSQRSSSREREVITHVE